MNDVKGLPEDEHPEERANLEETMREMGVDDQAMIQVALRCIRREHGLLSKVLKETLLPDTMQSIPVIQDITPLVVEASEKLQIALLRLQQNEVSGPENGAGGVSSDSPAPPARAPTKRPADGG